jgi:hypothetical protein
LLAENRPGVLIPFEGSQRPLPKFLPPWHRRSQKEIGDAILKDIRERPRPSGNFTADTKEAPAAACASLAHYQARRLREVHCGAGPYLPMRGGLPFFRHQPPARISSVLNESVFRALSHARKHPVHVGREHAL